MEKYEELFMLLEREAIEQEYTWNLEKMYASVSEWKRAFDKPRSWPSQQEYEADLGDPAILLKLLDTVFAEQRDLENLYIYAHHLYDTDMGEVVSKEISLQIKAKYMSFGQAVAWINPCILRLPESTLTELIEHPSLQPYRIFLQNIARMRPHTLSPEEEALFARSLKPLSSIAMAFQNLNNADFVFPSAVDEKGEERKLTHGMYIQYLRSQDRTLRCSAYKALLGEYASHQNAMVELLQGSVLADVYAATAKKYPDCLTAALYPNNIHPKVYHNLIKTVRAHLPLMHRYISLRKEYLGLSSLKPYDLYVPLVSSEEFQIQYTDAREALLASLVPLGDVYREEVRKGLYEERWVDVYETPKKHSGAYSGGCYDSYPYILMNYYPHGVDGAMTLAHELGHSMHSKKSREMQNYANAKYPIFVAEVASTLNEQLLLEHLLTKASTRQEKLYLIGYAIDQMCSTLFRQTLFAEFELQMHEWAEKGVPLTPQLLHETYARLYQEYYGPDLSLDDLLGFEFLRIPHFYSCFYVYQYATGMSAALNLASKLQQNEQSREKYLAFLSAGGSQFPLDLLQNAGVDMTKKEPIVSAMHHFESLVAKLQALLHEAAP
ncbi:MAG: oligoendopeptidase F [Chlamydiota bacterium]